MISVCINKSGPKVILTGVISMFMRVITTMGSYLFLTFSLGRSQYDGLQCIGKLIKYQNKLLKCEEESLIGPSQK